MPIITLTSDWGTKDHYLASVKGAILKQIPDARIIDISHHITPHNLTEAAFILRNAYRDFPEGTVHIVGISTGLTPELADEGLARELVHRLQTMRKKAGFDIADYIETYYQGGPDVERVMRDFGTYIGQETLSRALLQGPPPPDAYVQGHKVNGNEVNLGVRRLD